MRWSRFIFAQQRSRPRKSRFRNSFRRIQRRARQRVERSKTVIMATTAVPATLDEYMSTSYSPDCEYIDGLVVERNVGKGKHAYTQLRLGIKLTEQTQPKKLVVVVEQRVRISATRVRIPDVCVVEELEEVVTKAPLLCVEVLSPDDRWNRVIASVSDYQTMGV